MAAASGPRPWREAWETALYGPDGFYTSGRGAPGRDFRTSSTAGTAYAGALARLLQRVDVALGSPPVVDVVDVAAGQGELLLALGSALPPGLGARVRWTAVELAPRPAHLPTHVRWVTAVPDRVTGLLVANEWLDNVACEVVERDADGVDRTVLVDADGTETPGPPVTAAAAAWLRRWWPLAEPGDRAEVGSTRESAWRSACDRLGAGAAVAMDYGHRRGGRPPGGTLTGYRAGRQVLPVPDGRCDLTAHVALDACARPGDLLLTQREALRQLGVTGARPPRALATADPVAYLQALSRAAEEGELTAREGLGGFDWLVHAAPGVTGLLDSSGASHRGRGPAGQPPGPGGA